MIDLNQLNRYRIVDERVSDHYGSLGDGEAGCFSVPSAIDLRPMLVIASVSEAWDHVSVSRENRAPNQIELDQVFRLFFRPNEEAVQYFVPVPEHVNIHEHCLHLWRPRHFPLPKPPREFV